MCDGECPRTTVGTGGLRWVGTSGPTPSPLALLTPPVVPTVGRGDKTTYDPSVREPPFRPGRPSWVPRPRRHSVSFCPGFRSFIFVRRAMSKIVFADTQGGGPPGTKLAVGTLPYETPGVSVSVTMLSGDSGARAFDDFKLAQLTTPSSDAKVVRRQMHRSWFKFQCASLPKPWSPKSWTRSEVGPPPPTAGGRRFWTVTDR